MRRLPWSCTYDRTFSRRFLIHASAVQHKLTVIVSADVVGYSGLMERDEAGTLERLKANRRTIFDPRVAAHGGRIVKLMGDGTLVEFGSVVSAVRCVQEIQEATEADHSAAERERIRYSIAVTLDRRFKAMLAQSEARLAASPAQP